MKVGKYLVVDPGICAGQLAFAGTCVPVEKVFDRIARGKTVSEVLAEWPELKHKAIVEAISLARDALLERYADRREFRFLEPLRVGRYLIVHPQVCHGQLTFNGTRMPVETILNYVAEAGGFKNIWTDPDYIKEKAIKEAIRVAGKALRERYSSKNGGIHESDHHRRSIRYPDRSRAHPKKIQS